MENLQKAIGAKARDLRDLLENLEELVNDQKDTGQRHLDQARIHTIKIELDDIINDGTNLFARNT